MIKWNKNGDNSLWLFTVEEYHKLPNGITLSCIDGTTAIKGNDEIDLETRFGHIAYGVVNPWNHELKHIFLLFTLSN